MKRTYTLFYAAFAFLIIFSSQFLYSQPAPGCPNVNAGPDVNLACGGCTNLTATPFHVGSTTTYNVTSIPYAPPYPFNAGTAIFVGQDDIWSNIIWLPFSFCFFGNEYTQIVVGANGLISFNTAYAGAFCPWSYTAAVPNASLPLNSIFGAYHDIDPSVCGNIRYAILGAAPCRTFVVNYDAVCHYNCNALKTTQQIVLYETTNVIEVYIQNKPTCGSWNSGNAVVGIQNATGTVGFTPPGYNTGPWTVSNMGFRFTPDGAPAYTLEWLEGANVIATNQPTINVCPTTSTMYTARVTYNTCNVASAVTVTDDVWVNVTGIPTGANSNSPLCEGQTLNLTSQGGYVSYQWSGPNGFSSNLQNPSITNVTAANAGTYTVTVNDGTGSCSSTISVVINPLPTPIINATTPICVGQSATIIANGGGTYLWNTGDNTPSINVSPGATTTYTVTVTTGPGCSATATVTQVVNPPTIPVINPAGPLCNNGSAVILTASDPGGTWSATCGACIDAATGSFNPATAGVGNHTVTYTIAGPCGGSDTEVITVNDCSCLITNFTANIGACDLTTGQYSTSGTIEFINPPAAGQLVVQDCNGVQQTFNAPFVSPLNYILTGQNPNGAACSVSATFTAIPGCTQNIPYNAPICPCNMDSLGVTLNACDYATSTYDITGTLVFTFPPASGQLIIEDCYGNQVTFNAPFTSPVNFSFPNTPADGAPCSVNAYFTANPACTNSINFNNQDCNCPANIGNFTANLVGNGQNNYVLCYGDQIVIAPSGGYVPPADEGTIGGWNYDPGIAWLIYSCPPSPNTEPLNDPCFIGVYNTTGNGNLTDDNDLAVINAFPAGTFTNNTVYYVPMTMYNFPNLVYNVDCWELGAPIAVTYLPDITHNVTEDCATGQVTVTISGGYPAVFGTNFTASNLVPATANFVNNTTSNGGSIVVGGLNNGDNYSFTIDDGNGCVTNINGGPFTGGVTVTVNPQPNICDNVASVQFTTNATGGSWSATCGGCIDAATGVLTTALAGPGTHTVTYTVPGLCGDSDSQTFTIGNVPTANFSGVNLSGCTPVCATFTDLSMVIGSNITGWTWSVDGTPVSAQQNPTYCFNNPGLYDITLQVTSALGCTNTFTINDMVQVYPNPSVDFFMNPSYVPQSNPIVQFTDATSGNVLNWNWMFGDGGTSTAQNPQHTYGDTGTYCVTLSVITVNGCAGQDVGCLYVYPEVFIYIPNTFTPNDDKLNDWFQVEGVGIAEITMEIFNRWGESIYVTNSLTGWPGTIGSSTTIAKQDVYVYKIKLLDAVGEYHDFYGHVNLIR